MKMINKKGQQFSMTTLIIIVVGIIAAVLVILGFTGFFDTLFSTNDLLPSAVQQKASACKGYLSAGLAADYCTSLTEIGKKDGEKLYATCEYSPIDAATDKSSGEEITCADTFNPTIVSNCKALSIPDDGIYVGTKGGESLIVKENPDTTKGQTLCDNLVVR